MTPLNRQTDATNVPTNAASGAPAGAGARPAVLVVEDESLLARLQGQMLEKAGAEVVGPAPTLAGARSLVADRTLDGAIIDLGLPDGDGADLVNELTDRGVRCAVVTGRASFEAGSERVHPAATWIEKPVRVENLQRFVDELREAPSADASGRAVEA